MPPDPLAEKTTQTGVASDLGSELTGYSGEKGPSVPDELNKTDGDPPSISDHVVIRQIGKGGYGEVWLGRNAIGSLRAIKVVRRSNFSDDHAFEREFEGLRKFEPISRTHPGFVHILQIGVHVAQVHKPEDYFYYVMELADDVRTGQGLETDTYLPRTLAHDMSATQRLPLETSLPIGLSLASALAHLHEHKFIHRDLKPANIIFVTGRPKIADIGLITKAGKDVSSVGTLNYMPPEDLGEPTGDIFSLGKVFYGLFMGMPCKRFPELPGAAEEFTAVPALLQLNNLILKACHYDPHQRFQSAHELHTALLAVTETVQGKPPGTGAGGPGRSDPSSKSPPPGGRPSEGPLVASGEQRPKALWTRRAALLGLGGAIAGAAFFSMNRRKPVSAVPARAPVIVLMDTFVPRGVYDPDNIPKGRSNADELYTVLDGLDGIVQQHMQREGIGLEWARDYFVAGLHPEIVIIHRSSFFHPLAEFLKLEYPPFTDDADGEKLKKWQAIYDAQDGRLRSFIRTVGAVEPQTQFLIYSTGTDTNWLNDDFRANWTKTLELELPTFKGRINTMVIPKQPNGAKGTFRDPATAKEIRSRASEMIKELEKRKTEKSN